MSVHVVERVTTYDHVGRKRFVTRYAYHHGHFDGDEREFRGFGMVEQWDSEELATLTATGLPSTAGNASAGSNVPPVHTKTWFHTGIALGRDHVADFYASEYFREPGRTDAETRALLLPDTTLPAGLTAAEEREACRALKGSMLRQEVYADDAGPDADADRIRRSRVPYTVTEQSFTVRTVQARGANRHAVFRRRPACRWILGHPERGSARHGDRGGDTECEPSGWVARVRLRLGAPHATGQRGPAVEDRRGVPGEDHDAGRARRGRCRERHRPGGTARHRAQGRLPAGHPGRLSGRYARRVGHTTRGGVLPAAMMARRTGTASSSTNPAMKNTSIEKIARR